MKAAKQTKRIISEKPIDLYSLNNCKETLSGFLKYSLGHDTGSFNAGQLLKLIGLYEQLDELLIELRIKSSTEKSNHSSLL